MSLGNTTFTPQNMVHVVLIIWCAILPFESMNEILWCDHFNKAPLVILSHGAICFSAFYKMKFGNRCQNLTLVITFGSERVIMLLEVFLVSFDSLSGVLC